MKNGATILTAVLLAGCAAATDTRESRPEDMQYQREVERIETLERYETFKRNCARSGGIVVVRRAYGGRLAGAPSAKELKMASCSPPVVF